MHRLDQVGEQVGVRVPPEVGAAAGQGGGQVAARREVLGQVEDAAGGEGAAPEVGQVQAVYLLQVRPQGAAVILDQLDEREASPSWVASR
ncbi:hypothetical protein F4556_005181 [Kitasatospora gansuensis]|uniref:Uncharacterized protein n=1 Tax=Kitasatospora gansuensis TaxID=258050 RepID=A0A7W7SHZ7_9ACTN|nr:hypothetical protein [Kitasatospora gansuensis]MBB4949646.1 hypothetical protein [Kitasatospora gansuensis]